MLTYAMLPIGSVLLVLAQAPAAPAQPYVPPTRYVVVPSTTVQPPDAVVPPDAFVVRPGCLEPLRSLERRIAEQQKYIDDAKAKGYRLESIHQSTLDGTREILPRIRAGTIECEQRLRQEAADQARSAAQAAADHERYVKEDEEREAAERRVVVAAAKRKAGAKRPTAAPIDEPLQVPVPNCGNAPPLWVMNHSIRVVEKYLEKRLDDPDSLEWDDDACTPPIAAKSAQLCWTSVCRFRAKNKFGALVRQRVQFWFTEKEVLLAK